jgi:hypothetical protein
VKRKYSTKNSEVESNVSEPGVHQTSSWDAWDMVHTVSNMEKINFVEND